MVHIHTKLVILPPKKWFSLHSEEVNISTYTIYLADRNLASTNVLAVGLGPMTEGGPSSLQVGKEIIYNIL